MTDLREGTRFSQRLTYRGIAYIRQFVIRNGTPVPLKSDKEIHQSVSYTGNP